MRKPVIVLIIVGSFFILRFVSNWFQGSFNNTFTSPTFDPSYIVLRKGNNLPLYGAVQSQQKFHNQQQVFYNKKIEIEAKALIQAQNKPSMSAEVKRNSLSFYTWTEICKQSIDSIIYHPLFPHLPEQKTYTSKINFIDLRPNSGFYIFGKLKNSINGIHSLRVSVKNVVFQVWLSQDQNPRNGSLVLHDNLKESEQLINNSHYVGIVLKTSVYDGEFLLEWLQPGHKKYSNIPSKCLEPYQIDSPHLQMEELQKVAILKAKTPLSMMYKSKKAAERFNVFKIPFLPEVDTIDLFPSCYYEPSYLLKEKLKTQYAGQWETHFTSIYPDDETDMDIYHGSSTTPHVIYGNPIVKPTIAIDVVSKIVSAIQKKHNKLVFLFL